MALPATEDFNAPAWSDNDQIESSASWTLVKGAIDIQNTGSDGRYCGDTSGYCYAYWDDDTFDDDQYSQCVIDNVGGGGNYVGVGVRISETDNVYGVLTKNNTQIPFKEVNGSNTELGSRGADTVSNGWKIKIAISGTTITYYRDDDAGGFDVWTAVSDDGTHVDASLESGSAGIAAATDSGTGHADDWEGGDLAVGGISIPVAYHHLSKNIGSR